MRSTWTQSPPKLHQLVGCANQLCKIRRRRSPSEARKMREGHVGLYSSHRSRLRLQETGSNASKLSAMNAVVMGTLREIVRTGDRLKGTEMKLQSRSHQLFRDRSTY